MKPPPPRVLVRRSLPTEPAIRAAAGLFLAEAALQGVQADRTMLFVGIEPASEPIAAGLRVEPGQAVVARRKLLLANGVPVRIASSYLRVDLFGGTRLVEPEFVQPSLQAALEDLGHRFGHAEETLIARAATSFERHTLELDAEEWVVQVLRISFSTQDHPIHALETVCAATRHVFTITQTSGADEF